MAGNSITSTTQYLTRTTGSICSGSFSLIFAFKFDDSPATGVYRGIVSIQQRKLNTSSYFFECEQDPPDDGDNFYQFLKDSGGVTNKLNELGTNAALVGHWVHLALVYTGNTTAGSAKVYALVEGFNAGSPAYLITPDQGTVDPVVTAGSTNIGWDGGDLLGGGKIGHFILTPQALTEAQALAQFAQRAPTSTVTGGGSYTYLPCTDAANALVDAGTFASNFTAGGTGSFADSADQPSEWAGGASTNNRGKNSMRQLLDGTQPHLRMSPRSQHEAQKHLRARKRAYGFAAQL